MLVVVAAGCISVVSMSAGSIAQKMQEKSNAINDYQATIVVTTIVNGKSKVTESDIKIKKPDKFWYKNRETGVVTFVSNGTTMWTYLPEKNEVLITKLPKFEKSRIGFEAIIKNMMERFNIKLLGTGKIAGRDTYILKLVPKNKTEESLITEKLWVDQKYWVPVKVETEMKYLNETIQTTVLYENLEFNKNIPDSYFQYIIPKGAKVVKNVVNVGGSVTLTLKKPENITLQEAQKKVNFTILTPDYLPEGYKFSNAIVFDKIVAIIYKKAGSKFPLHFSENRGTKPLPIHSAEVVNINGNRGYYSSVSTIKGSSVSVLSWTSNNMVFVLTSTLSKKEMEKIAESVKSEPTHFTVPAR